ncbi:MAG: YHS domain-containing protein [Deltaproteobacteria bacterium]|nr:YHS domain-containing protein [Deltaproteobacteria bacterium]
MKKAFLVILAMVIGLSLVTSSWSTVPAAAGKAQTICPVMGGEINKNIYADYQGKRVYFCCTACIAEFNKDPEKFVKKLEGQGVKVAPAPGK